MLEKVGSRIKKRIEQKDNGCWTWTGATIKRHNNISGKLMVNKKIVYAHRYIFEICKGTKLTSSQVLLREKGCSTLCVNPDHYIVVDRDCFYAMLKFKSPAGESSPKAKLKLREVQKIRKSTKPRKELAKTFNVCLATINHIKTERTWKT